MRGLPPATLARGMRGLAGLKENSCCCPLHPHTTPFQEEKYILGVIYGGLLWADMNAATPLGAWGRSVMSLVAGLLI